VIPEWPPQDFDYAPKLEEEKLRKVEVRKWETEPEEVKGFKKVIELDTTPGMFTDSKGKLYDLRPQELCPSLANLRKKETSELRELAI